jgi:hypothetical protein
MITHRLLDKLSKSLGNETGFPISFEIQEDGAFLLVAIEGPADEQVGQRIADLVDDSVPKRHKDDSWMVLFTQDGKVVDSYSGGNF